MNRKNRFSALPNNLKRAIFEKTGNDFRESLRTTAKGTSVSTKFRAALKPVVNAAVNNRKRALQAAMRSAPKVREKVIRLAILQLYLLSNKWSNLTRSEQLTDWELFVNFTADLKELWVPGR